MAGVALGVAVVVSVDLAAASARRAFTLSTEAVTGRATHQIVGGPEGLDESLFRKLVVETGVHAAAPVVEGTVEVEDPDGDPMAVRLLGVDPFSEPPFRPYLRRLGRQGGVDARAFLTRPGAAVVSMRTARELGIGRGDSLSLWNREASIEIVGRIEPGPDTPDEALEGLAITDIATAQELLDKVGRLSKIDLRVAAGTSGIAELQRIRSLLPPGARVLAATGRSRALREMTHAFEVHLRALALLALICGAFLIYNTMTFSVVQRRRLLGTLRALGVTRAQVLAMVLGEAAAVALTGTLLGLAAGVALGQGLVARVATTINDLYFALEVRHLALDPWSLTKGVALGLGASVLAALAPAQEAVTASPRVAQLRSTLEARARRGVPRAAWAGAVLATLGVEMLFASDALVPGFIGLFAILMGLALSTPAATVGLMRLAAPTLGRLLGLLGRMAARGVVASLSRTAVALTALMLAVSVSVGVGILIGSFRGAVARWLESTLQADLYISPAGGGRGFDAEALDPDLLERIGRMPGVARASSVRRVDLEAGSGDRVDRTRLLALDIDERTYPGFGLKRGDPKRVWPAFQHQGAALVSEAFANRRRVGPGDVLTLPTDRGPRRFPIAAVYTDYSSDRGLVAISRSSYDRYWDDRGISGISVFLADGTDPERVALRVRALAPLYVRSDRALRQRSLEIFDRTFRITEVLRWLAGLVALIGVLSALMALQLERTRELGVLRANGLTPGRVWGLVSAQTALMGLVAGLLALPVGLVMAVVMVFVINRRSFGWSMPLEVPPGVLIGGLALALAAAILAGLYPAWKMARTSPALALREE